ncbi:TIGR04222 domain-containing membrane protein [Streptomyces tateyamensis]|uniref:TIGR04222 domain-containing membrane protein n=1 Tax=Streptomyces tateyamensis TaxID=565073 RepID=A0A2V4MWZ9_9ACTN|nr:TIGR04222 domain-containing membrane protein [Streptomyces tateyamensis]PYC73998.1 TIGR04222 domain-containing membrane protein [Streptomyces tateyamensis]
MWLLFLVPACVVAVLSCLRLVRVAAAADAMAGLAEEDAEVVLIGLYETAYLAGGPRRVVDLALVLMSGRGRLHLAHTGWTTVVDPQGRSRLERALISEIGPEGQCRTTELRAALSEHPTVTEIGVRLSLAGLATPAGVRENTVLAVRQVRQALLLGVLMLVAAVTLTGPADGSTAGTTLAWFSLPLILTTGTLLMARVDVHPYTRWAAPAGLRVLREIRLPRQQSGGQSGDAERRLLTAVAIDGTDAVPDARLRAALRG